MMKTLADLEAEHAAAVAKLAAEHALAVLCPAAPDYVAAGRGKHPPYIVYRKRTLTQALDLLLLFEIVPMWKHRGTFTEIVPEGMAEAGAEATDGPFAIKLEVSATRQSAPNAALDFFAPLADGRVARFGIDIEGPDYIGGFNAFAPSRQPVARDHRGNVTEWQFGPNGAINAYADSFVQWGAGDKNASRFSYLFQADQDMRMPAIEMSHAFGQLINLRDEFQPEAELVETTAAGSYWRFANDTYAVTPPGAPAPAWGHGYSLDFCKSVTERNGR